jgi:hypothetical protein
VAFLFVLLSFLSLMLMGLCGGYLMLEYQKSAAAAQPHQHRRVGNRMVANYLSKPGRVVGVRCDIKSEAKESQRIPADRLGEAHQVPPETTT